MAKMIKFSEVAPNQKFTSNGYHYQKNNERYNALCLAGGQNTPTQFAPDALVEVDDTPPAPKYKTVKLGSLKKGQVCKSVNSDTMYSVQDQLAGVQFDLHKDQTVSILKRSADGVAIAFGSGVDVLIEDDRMCCLDELKRGERFIDEKDNPGKTLRKICIGVSEHAFLIEGDYIAYTTNPSKMIRRIS